ncbi:FIST signal transduction protein [Accumulibacter sp.]|uniref:FIST signal transduction protein n=1 Tax=Accumulibacter sp. TaxID=2053492 RepID=UPI0028C50B20|nr:FIST N-terminal domain-containing protein [Accumulibacter sp.]
MQLAQIVLRSGASIADELAPLTDIRASLVLAFGAGQLLRATAPHLARAFPEARRVGCSTAGEISAAGVTDDSCVVTAIGFDSTPLVEASTRLAEMADSLAAGRRLAAQLPPAGLRAVLLFGQGVRINGSALLTGIADVLGSELPVTGGLAGDGVAFQETWVLDDDGVTNDTIVALGLYGERLAFSHASFGGWSPFGPARKITRCAGNVLHELDGKPALDVYKRYLGEHARGLPASGLLFPFALLGSDHRETGLIRSILGVDERDGSLTLAGEITPDGYLKLMHASTDALVSGAEAAAETVRQALRAEERGLALLVSCVGRKLVMGGRVDEEVEAVSAVFGPHALLAGFYSYGEIGPFAPEAACRLHNQTMSVTWIGEG